MPKMNLNYHIFEPSIKCPYCDKDCEDVECEIARNMEERIEVECDHCEKSFWAEAHIAYSTHSNCALNKQSHALYNSDSHPTLFHCENCSHYEVQEV